MSINIGDNFSYLGKKFLDNRQSFKTLEELLAFKSVPEGFIAYCEENKMRYEYIDGTWQEYKVLTGDSNPEDVIISEEQVLQSVLYIGDDEPGEEDDEKLWLDPSSDLSYGPGITIENPLIQEMLAAIQTLQQQVKVLQEEVEYLKINGGGGSGNDPWEPGDPVLPDVEESYLALEDGGIFLFEDGTYILLEESAVKPETPSKEEFLALEDGSLILLEDGSYILLEQQPIIEEEEETDSVILLENGDKLLFEDGSFIVLEQSSSSYNIRALIDEEGKVLLENNNKILVEKQ